MCPIIHHGTCVEIVSASIQSSYLWPSFQLYHMTIPIRQQTNPIFTNIVDGISDSAGPNINIPFVKQGKLAEDLINFIFLSTMLNDPIFQWGLRDSQGWITKHAVCHV